METSISPEMDAIGVVDKMTAPVKEEVKKERDESMQIADLKLHPGWIQIEEFIKADMENMDRAIPTLETVNAVGYHALVTRAVKEHLNEIISIVDANYDYQNERREGGSNGAEEDE